MKYDELLKLKKDLDLLKNHIDPVCGKKIVGDSILSNKYNQNVLNDAVKVIDKLIKLKCNPWTFDGRRKYNFYLNKSEINRIEISDIPISISAFTYSINKLVDVSVMKKIRATDITNWLNKNGYLDIKFNDEGNKYKIATEKGKLIGISIKKVTSDDRSYYINLYNSDAQKFILNNLEKIIDGLNEDIYI